MIKVFKVSDIKELEKQVSTGMISYTRMVEIMNELAQEAHSESQKSEIPCGSEMFCVMVDSKKTLSFHKSVKGANNRVTEWEKSQFEGVFSVEKIEVEE